MAPAIAAALIGGGASLLGTGISSWINKSSADADRREAAKRRQVANQQISNWEGEANRILEEAMKNNVSLSSADDLNTYQQLKQSYDPSKYVYNFDQFDKSNYNVEDYLNPARDQIISDLQKSVQNTAAGAALGHSSGALEAINQATLNKSEELYDKAYDRMTAERNFDYGAYTNYINQQQQRLNAMQQGVLGQMQNLRGDITFDQQQQDAYLANKLNLGNALAQTRASLV